MFVLIDSRHGIKPVDAECMDSLDEAAVSYQAVLTKADKIKSTGVAYQKEALAEALKTRPAAHPTILATSSEKKQGIDDIRSEMLEALKGWRS